MCLELIILFVTFNTFKNILILVSSIGKSVVIHTNNQSSIFTPFVRTIWIYLLLVLKFYFKI